MTSFSPPPPATSEILRALRPQIQVLAFDCDGVLFDSKAANIRFYNQVLSHFGRPDLAPEREEFVHMHSVRESLELLFDSAKDLLEPARAYCAGLDFRDFNRYLTMEPGLVETLTAGRSAYRIALATNRTVSARGVLEHFGLLAYFDVIVTAADVLRPKPMPDMMHLLCERLAVAPEAVLFIGDSRVDEQFAAATGVIFAAYKNPALQAHCHLQHFRQLQPLFQHAPDLARHARNP